MRHATASLLRREVPLCPASCFGLESYPETDRGDVNEITRRIGITICMRSDTLRSREYIIDSAIHRRAIDRAIIGL